MSQSLRLTPSAPKAIHVPGQSTERWIDDELAQSFPASDPPSWTMGVELPDDHHHVAPTRRNP